MHTPSHLGPLTQLTIGLRPSLPGDRWHLNRVEITDESTGLLYIFFCQAWLGDDGQDSVVLKASGSVRSTCLGFRVFCPKQMPMTSLSLCRAAHAIMTCACCQQAV